MSADIDKWVTEWGGVVQKQYHGLRTVWKNQQFFSLTLVDQELQMLSIQQGKFQHWDWT
jgi:hypothetical protein